MKVRIKLEKWAFMPLRAHRTDAGLDIRTPKAFTVKTGESEVIDTGVHLEIPGGYVGMLKSKSGLNVKKGILSEGVIDAGYTGSIVAKLYNHGNETVKFIAGDKITQLVIVPILVPEIETVDRFDETDRGDNGFGSSGR